MNPPLDVAALLEDLSRAATVALEAVPALLAATATEEAKWATLRTVLAARLALGTPRLDPVVGADDLVDVQEAARLVHRSTSWMRKHGHTVPGFQQPSGKGCKVAWSRRALEAWAGGAC